MGDKDEMRREKDAKKLVALMYPNPWHVLRPDVLTVLLGLTMYPGCAIALAVLRGFRFLSIDQYQAAKHLMDTPQFFIAGIAVIVLVSMTFSNWWDAYRMKKLIKRLGPEEI